MAGTERIPATIPIKTPGKTEHEKTIRAGMIAIKENACHGKHAYYTESFCFTAAAYSFENIEEAKNTQPCHQAHSENSVD